MKKPIEQSGTRVIRVALMPTQKDADSFLLGVEYGQALAARDLKFLREEVNNQQTLTNEQRIIIADQKWFIVGLFTGLVLAVGTLVGLFFWSQS